MLISSQRTNVIKGFTSKNGKKFDASLKINSDGKIDFIFPNAKKATFYIYVLLSINVYRKEIELRFNDGYKINRNIKAPYPIRVMVLFTLVALAANWLFFIIFGEEKTILINSIPVLFFVNLLWRYKRRIKKIDKENSDVLL